MSASETPEATSGPFFKPEFHSWILIPDTASFRQKSSEETPPGYSETTAASEEAPDTSSCVTAESVIFGTTDGVTACSSSTTSPVASCDKLSSLSELLTPSWPLALPRPCADALDGLGRDGRIARVVCHGDDADSATGGSSRESECSLQQLSRLGCYGRPLAIFAALLASHFGVLVLGIYLGGRQQQELTCLLRRFSSGSSGWQGRICAA